jgi:hypothetical protein
MRIIDLSAPVAPLLGRVALFEQVENPPGARAPIERRKPSVYTGRRSNEVDGPPQGLRLSAACS